MIMSSNTFKRFQTNLQLRKHPASAEFHSPQPATCALPAAPESPAAGSKARLGAPAPAAAARAALA